MEIDINEVLAAYGREVAALTQRAILAERQVAALQVKIAKLEEAQSSDADADDA